MTIQIKKIHPDATFEKAHQGDAGYDLTACEYTYERNGLFMIKLGVQVQPHPNTFFEIIPRSSFSSTGFIMPNGVGVIDAEYRGEWKFPIRHLGCPIFDGLAKYLGNDGILPMTNDREYMERLITTLIGTRIAQAIIRPLYLLESQIVASNYQWDKTDRDSGGFGSTGL